MNKNECIARLTAIISASAFGDYTLEISANDWQKGDKDRTYFAIIETSKISKHYKKKTYGFLDNVTGEYFPDKYGDLRNNFTFSGAKF